MSRRILHIIPSLDRSGAEKQLVLLASHLPRDRFETHVAVLTRSGPLADDLDRSGVAWTLIGKRAKLDPLAWWRLANLIRSWRPDVVHTWLFAANAYGRSAAAWCGVPRIVTAERCVDPWKRAWHHKIDRALAPVTNAFVTNSRGIADFYETHGIARERFTIIPNAIVTPPVITSEERERGREQLARSLNIRPLETADAYIPITPHGERSRETFLVGVVARLWEQKRLDDLFWIAELAHYANADIHFVVIGDGPLRDDLLRERDSRGLFHHVHFIGHRNDVALLLPLFDVVVSTSAYEGESNAILEAMSAGVAVIASDISGNADLVNHGDTGILIPECGGDAVARRRLFGEAVLRLYEDEALRFRLANAGRSVTLESRSLAAMVESYAEFYDCLFDATRAISSVG
ncbi:MAG: glycosyltransferase [Thermoguttaceae bacterium]